jgi:hypothetical protein
VTYGSAVAELSDRQRATRARFESLIGAAAPLLDIVLGVGERISRIAEPTDHEYYPVRAGSQRRLRPGPQAAEDTPPAAGGATESAPAEPDAPASQ